VSEESQSPSRDLDGRFAKGHPGGPGRPRKAVKVAADALDERVAQAAGDLIDVVLKRAGEGNLAAAKMLLDRVWPAGRSRPLEISAPEINHPRDLLTAMAGVTNAVLAGDATAEEGVATAKVLKEHLHAIADIDLEARITEYEEEGRRMRESQK
jgi:hypothetical protein